MQGTLYEERIYSKWNIIVMSAVVLALLASLIWQLVAGPLGTRPAPNWLLLAMIIFFLVIGINFATLTIRVNMQGITVGYGVIRHDIPWSNIAGCYIDKASAVRYGGWGIRLGWADGKKRLAYNILGSPRVVVEKRQGSYQEFVFSTRNPEGVMKAIEEGPGSNQSSHFAQG